MDTVLELKIKTLTFPGEEAAALKDIDLTVAKGEFLAVTGEAAGGKSLLLHTMTGAAVKYEGGILDGSVALMGKDVMTIPLPAVSEYLGFMFQEPQNQIVSVSVAEEVGFGPANLGCSRREIRRRVEEALAFTGLTGLNARKTTALSGGQAQRLVLAGVLALKAPLLILDQPGAELDQKGRNELYDLIKRLHEEEGVTVVMAMDHGVDVAAYADRVIEMKGGGIARQYTPADFPKPQAVSSRPGPGVSAGEPVLALKDVSYTYKGGVSGCRGISFEVCRGELLTVMGENGSGKTTLLKLMEGLLFPEKGSVKVFDETMTKKSAFALRKRMGFLFQNPDFQIFANTVREEAAFALGKDIDPAQKAEKAAAALAKVGLAGLADCHPQRLSRSQRQKLAAASALIHAPEIVIADEPTAGLNGQDSVALMELLADFRAAGNTVIMVSHDPELALAYSDRILLLDAQKVAGCYERIDFPGLAPLLLKGGFSQDESKTQII